MHQRTALNALLLVLLLVLIFAAIRLDERADQTSAGNLTRVTDIEPGSIQRILIVPSGKPEILMKKTGADWVLADKASVPVNPARIVSILGLLRARSMGQFHAGPADKQQYGLDPANLILALDDHRFYFGDINPLDRGRYLLFEDTIHTVDDTLYHQLYQPPLFFAANRLFPPNTRLVSINLIDIELSFSGKWQTIAGNRQLSDEESAEIASAWGLLEASSISAPGVFASMGEIVLVTAQGQEIRFSAGIAGTELILTRKDPAIEYRFPAGTARHLGIKLDENR